jgi:hypothetical protein
MTKLNKPVRRVSDELVRSAGKSRPLVVTIYPGDVIGLRPQGTRQEERTTLRACYDLAIKLRVRSERRERKETGRGKRKS